jgi:gas vesicle protein
MRSFIVGLGIGIGLGVLFAPMSGEATRGNLKDRANDLADQARETYEQGRDRVRSGVASIRDMAQRATGTTGNVGTTDSSSLPETNNL